jgi:hypothetical protein
MVKKRKKRIKIEKEVIINRVVKAEGLDLSEDGMYIYTRSSFLPNSIVEVGFSLENEPISVMAEVQHVENGIGIGVKFVELSEDVSGMIKRYVSSAGDS